MKSTAYYKIFGERNSGTNLLRYLVGDDRFLPDEVAIFNLRYVERAFWQIGKMAPKLYDGLYDRIISEKINLVGGWKHAVPDINILRSLEVVPVFIVKHPTYWLESFRRRPFHHYRQDEVYVPRRIENMERRPLPINDLIMAKMTAFAETSKQLEGIVVQYETLVAHFDEVQKALRGMFGKCRNLPKRDVRNFVSAEAVTDYQSAYRNPYLESRAAIWERHPQFSATLKFFGYETGCWRKTLPFTL
jgi:hypothetical protein